MATCRSCGGDNAPGKARCQYCDQPLVDVRTLELDWDVVTPTGARGRGRARLHAAPGFDAAAARGVVEAAFTLAVTIAGADAGAARVQAAMAERLPGLLPPGTTVESITVESVSAFVLVADGGPAPAASPPQGSGASCSLGCAALALALCCLLSGVSSFGMSFAMVADAEEFRSAKLVTPAEAAQADGYVALEAVTVSAVSSDAPLAPDGARCLWLRAQPRSGRQEPARWASSFRVGPVEVRVAPETTFDGAEAYPLGVERAEHLAILADRPVTILGRASHGVLDSRLRISTRRSRDELAEELERTARAARGSGLACSAVGLIALVVGFVARRAQAQRRG